MLLCDILKEIGKKRKIFFKFLSTSNRLDFFFLSVGLSNGKKKTAWNKENKPHIKTISTVRDCAVVLICGSVLKG